MSKQKKYYFFEKTSTLFKKGSRFLRGDVPSEETFRNLIQSTIFSTDISDRAKLDTGTLDSSSNGHTVLATDSQVFNFEDQKEDRSLVVQPHQTTSVSGKEEAIGTLEDTTLIEVSLTGETKRKSYALGLSTSFKTWLLSKLVPAGGTTSQILSKLSDADNYVGWANIPPESFTEDAYLTLVEEGETVPSLGEDNKIPISYLPDEIIKSSILSVNAQSFGASFIYSGAVGKTLLEFPNLIIVSFNQTNVVEDLDFKVDSLDVVKLKDQNSLLEVGQITPNTPYLLVKNSGSYNILGLPRNLKVLKLLKESNFTGHKEGGDLLSFDINSRTVPSSSHIDLPSDSIKREIQIIGKANWNRLTGSTPEISGVHYLEYNGGVVDTSITESVQDNPTLSRNYDATTVVIHTFTHYGDGGQVRPSFSSLGDQYNITDIKTHAIGMVD